MNLHGSNDIEKDLKKNLGQGNNCVPECFLLACLNFLHLLKDDHSKKGCFLCIFLHITRQFHNYLILNKRTLFEQDTVFQNDLNHFEMRSSVVIRKRKSKEFNKFEYAFPYLLQCKDVHGVLSFLIQFFKEYSIEPYQDLLQDNKWFII